MIDIGPKASGGLSTLEDRKMVRAVRRRVLGRLRFEFLASMTGFMLFVVLAFMVGFSLRLDIGYNAAIALGSVLNKDSREQRSVIQASDQLGSLRWRGSTG